MDKGRNEEILQSEIIDIEKILNAIITELRNNTKESEMIAEQMIRDSLNEKILLE